MAKTRAKMNELIIANLSSSPADKITALEHNEVARESVEYITGQVVADSIGNQIYSGIGGQLDFIRGSARSRGQGGKPIIALPSTAKGGKETRIVPYIKEGAGVVTSRGDVHFIATEYGIVDLFGKNLKQRAEALISIAHPDFREQLTKESHWLNL